MSKICSFFGSDKIDMKVGLEECLAVLVEHLTTKEHFDVFCFGGIGCFDDLCYSVTRKFKEKHNGINLVLILPEHKTLAKELCEKHYGKFDKMTTIKSKDGLKLPILSRNIEMAKASEFVVFFANESGRGNETKVLNFAKEQNIPFVNLF